MVEMYYKGYFITGDERFGYIAVAPYGAFFPQVFSMIIEAKRAINEDIKDMVKIALPFADVIKIES